MPEESVDDLHLDDHEDELGAGDHEDDDDFLGIAGDEDEDV